MPDIPEILQTVRGANILAINPPVHDFAYFDLWARPLGLLYVLEYMRTRGNSVTLIDCIAEAPEKHLSFGRIRPMRSFEPKPAAYRNIPRRYWRFGLSREDLDRRLTTATEPDLVLVTSMMTYWYTGVWETIRQVKEIYPDVPVILGGVYARLCPEHAAGSGADYVIDRHFPLPAHRPALDLYARPGYAVSLTSTGCPMNCDYCASSALWPCFSQRPVEEALEEIAFQISRGDIHDVAFYDDALLIGSADHFIPLCRKLGERFKNLRYHTPNGLHVREISPEVARLMAALDFSTIRLSLESVDSEVTRSGSEKVSRRHFREAVQNLVAAGFEPGRIETYVLVGLPGQSAGSVIDTIRFAASFGARVKTAQFSPIPKTALFDRCAELAPELRFEPLLSNNTVFAPWIGKTILPGELQRIKHMAVAMNEKGAARQ